MIKCLLPAFLLFGAMPLAAQVASVPRSGDVGPADPSFLALTRLVEHNGCIAGYPDGTFRGNRPLTRYEFAAALHPCADRVHQLIASGQAVDSRDQADLAMLEREFARELATLRGRIGTLEERTAKLEAQQFSTTTKLSRPGAMQGNPRKLQKRKRRPPPGPDASLGN